MHHFPYPLDVDRVITLSPIVEGEHDFTAFAGSGDRGAETQQRCARFFLRDPRWRSGRLIYRVRGSGFLKHMVRNIVGTLIEAGKGNIDEAGLRELLIAKDRKAGPTALAKGLFLVGVEYGS